MGQYFNIFNLDKKEKLNPRCFGEGLKLMEFGSDSLGVLTGLTLLLRQSSGGGGETLIQFFTMQTKRTLQTYALLTNY